MTEKTTKKEWSDWEAEACGLVCEVGVGLTIQDETLGVLRWLCWDEVIEMHDWLGRKIKENSDAE